MVRIGLVLAFVMIGLGTPAAHAQPGTPEAGRCQIPPRTNEEVADLAALAATPAGETPLASVRLPAGEPVDEESIDLLLATLNEADACAQARDLARFLALYTDEFVIHSILAPEPVGVLPGERPAGQEDPASTPSDTPVTVIDGAALLDDGRIAAHVVKTGEAGFGSIVWFEFTSGRWLIDDIRRSADPPSGAIAVPDDAKGIGDLVVADAAAELGTSPEEIELVSVEAVDWPDAGLGCPQEGGVYAAVITPGFQIVLSDGATSVTYHTDSASTVVRCDSD